MIAVLTGSASDAWSAWGRRHLLALEGWRRFSYVAFGPGSDGVEDRGEGLAGFGQRVAGAWRHRRVDRLGQHASALELTQALGKRGRIDADRRAATASTMSPSRMDSASCATS